MTEQTGEQEITSSEQYAKAADEGRLNESKQQNHEGERNDGSLLNRASDAQSKQEEPKAEWYYANGVPGSGEKPEWLKDSKYKSVEDQAKAYNELEKKFGSFKGAPEKYEVKLQEDLQDKLAFNADDPFYKSFESWAKEKNFSNDAFNELLNLYGYHLVKAELDLSKSYKEQMEKEFEKLGEDRQKVVDEVAGWVKANVSEDDQDAVMQLANSASGIKFLHKIAKNDKYQKIDSEDGISTLSGYDRKEQLKKMMADPRWLKDMEYTKRVEKLYQQ